MEQAILVYVDLMGIPMKVGQLWGRFRNGRERMSSEYDRNWLNHPKRFSLDPALKLVAGFFHEMDRMASAFEHKDLQKALQ